MMPLTQLEREREDQAKESKGQKEDLQATLAKLHLKTTFFIYLDKWVVLN
jgi:hypothetical protein